jgi:hypothetical protein
MALFYVLKRHSHPDQSFFTGIFVIQHGDIGRLSNMLLTLTNLLSTDIKKGDISRLFINY